MNISETLFIDINGNLFMNTLPITMWALGEHRCLLTALMVKADRLLQPVSRNLVMRVPTTASQIPLH